MVRQLEELGLNDKERTFKNITICIKTYLKINNVIKIIGLNLSTKIEASNFLDLISDGR